MGKRVDSLCMSFTLILPVIVSQHMIIIHDINEANYGTIITYMYYTSVHMYMYCIYIVTVYMYYTSVHMYNYVLYIVTVFNNTSYTTHPVQIPPYPIPTVH